MSLSFGSHTFMFSSPACFSLSQIRSATGARTAPSTGCEMTEQFVGSFWTPGPELIALLVISSRSHRALVR